MFITVAIIVSITIIVISGIIWGLIKYVSKASVLIIPIIGGLLAGILFLIAEEEPFLGEIIAFVGSVGIIALAVVATLASQLHATIFDLERKVAELSRERN